MRFKLDFKTNNNVIPIDYRRFLLSYIKNALSNYDEKIYSQYYNKKDPIHKNFTFTINFGKSKFEKEKILLEENKFSFYYSTSDYVLGTHLFAAFREQINREFKIKNNSINLCNIKFFKSKNFLSKNIDFKILSPVLIRDHKKDNSDVYYSFEDKEFEEILKNNLKYRLKDFPSEYLENISIIPIKTRSVLVKNYGTILKGNLGYIKILANEKVIEYIYQSGLGSKNSMGFGMLEISKRG
ncbi:CRISPR-associated endoribonuclease Cas6 [Oceanotoga teriensis]|uniref:CRISPR-associated endoribonuclease Cas6 n=1 Tax=Oceanotoga teriensis TaxID=515440 RepID=A0AA45C6W5_9BACT|nr:CRISPR-associated endoribonuclease Cas6 [Oceanotoga teriensis]PWJ93311.1 CRISPR-associated endoribonuclease Cas6 [Oceanotoga teriensis]